MDIQYRSYRNYDPPALVQIWNEALTGRSAAILQGTTPLDYFVLAKPYFDPKGLILAIDGVTPVGFAHAGFGPDDSGQRLSTEQGVICMVVVRPSHRGRGIASQLLRHAEAYLRSKGAQTIFAGPMRPLNPFYWGIYGGSEAAGFLASDPSAEPFLRANGYVVWDRCLVMNRSLDPMPPVVDPRFPLLRRKVEVQITPASSNQRWYDACLRSNFEMLLFQLKEIDTGEHVAQATVWDMDMFAWRWHQPSVGIIDVEVRESHRRQGLGKFLITQILAYLQDQYFSLVEIQTMERNLAAMNLYQSLGFQKVDEGRVYRLEENTRTKK